MNKKGECEMIVYSRNKRPIFICTKWHPDEHGGQAIQEETYCLLYGEGIDLDLIGLSIEKPTLDKEPGK